ncbi:hypothetical protein F5Y16DRAFT_413623 [Xylariaceae sp. FL0255]|nr:hypothetical protein F5Y16DRAFT_413623 [Xylariaceae sp. FL0255]
MSSDQPTSSFGDPNALPPTPKETPTSAEFPQSVFETPKPNHARPDDSSSCWTPHFAEEYSVFNSTPGNLRGSSGPFLDRTPLYQSSSPNHKRLLSAESLAAEIASHVNHFSPTSTLPLPPVDLSRQLPSSPTTAGPLPSPTETKQLRSGKKPRRGTLLDGQQQQTATPPPSARKGERQLAPKPQSTTMQNDEFDQDFVAGTSHQQQHLSGSFVAPMDMFGMSLSAPATAQPFDDGQTFWDSGMNGMDIDFSMPPVSDSFQASGHRPMNSLDWGKANEIFQDTGMMPTAPNQENNPQPKKERLLAPKPVPMPNVDTSMADGSVFATSFPVPGDDPFSLIGSPGGVNPGLLFSQPPPSNMDLASFNPLEQTMMIQALGASQPLPTPTKETKRGQVRRSASTREVNKAKKNDRPALSSPVKPASRPGLLRSASESRGRKPINRNNTPNLAPAIHAGLPQNQVRSSSQGSRSSGSGRISPLKIHHRLSSLSSIPENSGPRTRTSVRFTIDSRGRARAETTVIVEDGQHRPSSRHRRGEQRKDWDSSGDESSSTDDEPIIVPSRNSSFAMPEPGRPSYSRSPHVSQRNFSDHSTSSLGIYYTDPTSSQVDGDSDAETVMDMPQKGKDRGDAMSELRKVREDRQKRVPAINTNHHVASSAPFSASSAISPTSFTKKNLPTPSTDRGNQIRCICNTTLSHINGNGYMVQCESCEMWLHGNCVNISRQTLPRVYICAFCANTPNAHGGRGREMRRSVASKPHASASSPLAHKSVRSFRLDHCGPEVVAEAVKVLKAVEAKSTTGVKFNLQDHLLGGCSINAHGTPLTDEALSAAKSADAVLLGAIGGPEWGTGAFSPLKPEVCKGTDFTIIRELTGGIYFGDRKEDDGSGYALDTEPYSRAEIERITRLAAHLALTRSPPAPIWSLDKANVLATSRLWRKVVTEVMAKEFPQLELHHQLIDSAAMIMVKNPRGLNGVVVTSNLFGDIISDEASVIPGSIGLSPSASLSGIPDGQSRCNGIYEPIHGSAPDISGKGIVNPIGTILSVAMMCRYSLALPKEADLIEKAVKNVLDSGVRTKDLGGETGTQAMGDAVVAELNKLIKA